jgi:hypothetical protein
MCACERLLPTVNPPVCLQIPRLRGCIVTTLVGASKRPLSAMDAGMPLQVRGELGDVATVITMMYSVSGKKVDRNKSDP